MSLFSFGSSKHSTFHARITLHELDNVPLLHGAFHIKWKVSNSQHISASSLNSERDKEKRKRSKGPTESQQGKEGAGLAKEASARDGVSPASAPANGKLKHHHRCGHCADQGGGNSKLHQSQQITAFPSDLLDSIHYGTHKAQSTTRAQRQAASDPGQQQGPDGIEVMQPTSDSVKDQKPNPGSLHAFEGHCRIPSGAGSYVSSIQEQDEEDPGIDDHASKSGPEPNDIELQKSSGSDDDEVEFMNDVHASQAHDSLDDSRGTAASSSSSSAHKRGSLSSKGGRLSRFLHVISPTSTALSIGSGSDRRSPGTRSLASSRVSSGASHESSHSQADAQSGGVRAQPHAHAQAAHGSAPSHSFKPGKLLAPGRGHPSQHCAPSPPISTMAESGAGAARTTGATSSGEPEKAKDRQIEGDVDADAPAIAPSGEAYKGVPQGGNNCDSDQVGLDLGQQNTQGLDLTRERPSLSSKHSSSRLSTTSSKGKGKGKGGESEGDNREVSKSGKHHDHHHYQSNSNRPGSSQDNSGGASASSAVVGPLTSQLEPKGTTHSINVKDHIVKWERTFEVGIRVPIEKYKSSSSSKESPPSGSPYNAASWANVGHDDSGSSNVYGSGAGSAGSASGLQQQKSKSSLRKEFEAALGGGTVSAELERERERERELAEAWGILGKAMLRLMIKQNIETDELQGTNNDSDLGFVELNLAEYAPWPPASMQAQVLAPHKSLAQSSHRHRHRVPRRAETRRYLLHESKSNSKLKITVEMTFIAGTAEYAVPHIKRGSPVNGLADYVHASSMMASSGIARRQQAQHVDACSGGDCDCDRASFRSTSSKGTSGRPSGTFVRGSENWNRSSTSLSIQNNPYGALLFGNNEPILRSSIPAKNFRDASGASAASNKSKNSYGTSGSSLSSSFVERDPTSIIDMIFDQAKYHAMTPTTSVAHTQSSTGAHKATQAQTMPSGVAESSRPTATSASSAASTTRPSIASSASNNFSGAKKSPFSFRTRKNSNKNPVKDQPPTQLASPANFGNSLTAFSSSTSLSLVSNANAERQSGDIQHSSSQVVALTASPEQLLSPIAIRGSEISEIDIARDAPRLQRSVAAIDTDARNETGIGVPNVLVGVPNIDISSPSGRTFASFTSNPFSLLVPANECNFEQNSSLEDASFSTQSTSSERPRLRSHTLMPATAFLSGEASNAASAPKTGQSGAHDNVSSAFSNVTAHTLEKKRTKELKGKMGIAPEQAHAKGYKGIGWQSPSSEVQVLLEQRNISPTSEYLLDVSSAAASHTELSRHGSSESYESIGSVASPLVTAAPYVAAAK
ncbi:hypothetical protein K437DRAFT_287396 [Tilletiaria anomala UBC 951]|uniref:C2 NT-type domain-containing protein n=1 Tax=Tilletiaria anomala (strain ATCC 24038 / CBS 436.72 / UBC 951) TaxID=1037660 RepID=A0A066VNF9_TILAU|nr:uncharacterized protein K437DRAFT_287396 [Tilletiaria anomala UBC 951]KDN43006.1 hypothetical protein K437DRAFT_287396 [Tilletiaria anomala UBC 951]